MTTYIALFNLTDTGIKAAKDSPRRLDVAKKLLADMGGEMKQFYMVWASSTLSESARRRTTPRPAARGPRLRAHENAEGVPGDRLPAKSSARSAEPRRLLTAMSGPVEHMSDVILRLVKLEAC